MRRKNPVHAGEKSSRYVVFMIQYAADEKLAKNGRREAT
jgi:hypothetical protein